jgi:selenium-binding protein 1
VQSLLGGVTRTANGKQRKLLQLTQDQKTLKDLPELIKGFGAVPVLVTDIDLSLDDKYLYVACWGIGEMHQYDVSDPFNPVLSRKS